MEFQELIEKRQSVRKYLPDDIPEDDIKKMVDAARIAPSAKNMQNWHYVAIKDKSLKAEIYDAVDKENLSICETLAKTDKEKADKFRKFASIFTLFIKDAPLLFVVFSATYLPSGYNELCDIDKKDFAVSDLIHLRNPGLQNVGASVEHLYLKANELGYGMCWLTSANYVAHQIEKILKEKKIFDNPDYYMVNLLSVGKPSGESKSPGKKNIEDILTIV